MSPRAFSLTITAYIILWVALVIYISRVFGSDYAVGLSLILVLPLVFALRMRTQWHSLRTREFVYLGTLLLAVLGASGTLIWYWYDAGVDADHAIEMELVAFRTILRGYPAFDNVQFNIPGIGRAFCKIRGTVRSQADLDRLKEVLEEYNIDYSKSLDRKVVVSP